MNKIFVFIGSYIDAFGLLLPLFTFWILGKKIVFPGKKYSILYFAVYFILTLYATIIADLGYYNTPIYDVAPLILSLILFLFFRQQSHSKQSLIISKLLLLLLFCIYALTWKNVFNDELNTEYYLFFSIFILVNTVYFILNEINQSYILNIYDTSQFWFIVSLAFYALASAIVWGSFEYIQSRPVVKGDINIKYFWIITHNPILFVSCLVFSISLIPRVKKLKM